MRKTIYYVGTVLVTAIMMASCSIYTKPQRVEDYLHYVEFEKYDFGKLSRLANSLFDGKKKMPSAPACSAIRKDSLLGRNFDWYYDQMPEFVIYSKGSGERYASLGVAAPISVLKEKQLKSLWGKVVLNLLPLFTVDGINEKGVSCCINVTPQGDCGYTTGTNPGQPRMYEALFVRYVLDNASSAAQAVRLLDSLDIYTSTAYGLKEDYHFLIADSVSTYVVEFTDNKAVVLDGEHIITNFNISAGITPHAMGIERMAILREGESLAQTHNGMFNLLRSVWFSGMYDPRQDPLWLSEVCSNNDSYNLTTGDITAAPEKFIKPFEQEREKYLGRSRSKPDTWHTVHTSIYNINTGTLSIYPQESDRRYDFVLTR